MKSPLPRTCLWIMLFMLAVPAAVPSTAYSQHLTSKFETNTGSYIRARLLHSPAVAATGQLTRNAEGDRWLAFDKVEHATFGFLFTLGGQYVLVSKAGLTENEALPLSVGVAASAGLAKELWDLRRRAGVFSARDLAADAVGILLATTLILI